MVHNWFLPGCPLQVVVTLASNVTFDAGVAMHCPRGTNFVDTFGGLYEAGAFPVQTTACANSATNSLVLASSLQFSCTRCGEGLYSLFGGSSNGSAGASVDFPCRVCPQGGLCTEGDVQATPNYWGAPDGLGVVTFASCPAGYVLVVGAVDSYGGSCVGQWLGCVLDVLDFLFVHAHKTTATCLRSERLSGLNATVVQTITSTQPDLLRVKVWECSPPPVTVASDLNQGFLEQNICVLVVCVCVVDCRYCCDNSTFPCTSASSCAGSRAGLLCGDCIPGYTETLGSSQCGPVVNCAREQRMVWSLVVLALLCVGGVQLVVVSGVGLSRKTAPSGRLKLMIYYAQVCGNEPFPNRRRCRR
jgi:hypothetical protein